MHQVEKDKLKEFYNHDEDPYIIGMNILLFFIRHEFIKIDPKGREFIYNYKNIKDAA